MCHREGSRLEEVVEKQADLIEYLKQHNTVLSKRLLNLTAQHWPAVRPCEPADTLSVEDTLQEKEPDHFNTLREDLWVWKERTKAARATGLKRLK